MEDWIFGIRALLLSIVHPLWASFSSSGPLITESWKNDAGGLKGVQSEN